MTAPKSNDARSVLRGALAVVFKRKRLIAALSLVIAAGIALAVLSVPSSYEVAGKLVVTRARGDLLVTPADQRTVNFAITAPAVQDMAVHAELLKNRSLIEAVVRALGGGAAGPGGPELTQSRANAEVDAILAGLTVQVVPNSNLIYVRYRSSDPARGADVVNTLLDLYRETYLKMRSTPGVPRFFEEQRDLLAARLKRSERSLFAFEDRTALLAGAVQVDAYSRRLAEAEDNAIDAQFDLSDSEQRAAMLKAEIDKEPERIQSTSTIRRNPMVETAQERLLTLRMDKEHLLTLYTPDDRRVLDKQREIDAQERQLAEARAGQWVPESEVTQINGRRQDLEMRYVEATLSAQKNRIRAEGARAIAGTMRDRVRELSIADVERQALEREIQASTDAYLLYRKKADEARVTAAMDTNHFGNVAIGEPASRQGTPVGPPRNLSLVFAVAVGVVTGVGAAFLREFFDGSVKGERDVGSALDLPVLGSISEAGAGRPRRDEQAGGSDGGSAAPLA